MLGHRPLTPEDYGTILKRRWWIIAIPAVIFPIIGFAITYLVPPEYVSQTLVLVMQQKVPESYVKPVISEDLNARLATMKEQILSRSRLAPIIERFNLYANQGMSMDDRIDKARKGIGIKPIQSDMTRGLPGFFIYLHGGRCADGAARVRGDYIACLSAKASTPVRLLLRVRRTF